MDSLGLCIINGHCRGFLGPCVGRVTCTSLPLAKMITLFVAKAIRCAQIIAKSLEKLKPQEMKEKPKKTVEVISIVLWLFNHYIFFIVANMLSYVMVPYAISASMWLCGINRYRACLVELQIIWLWFCNFDSSWNKYWRESESVALDVWLEMLDVDSNVRTWR